VREMVISAHQPVLFPNNAFFAKMKQSDLFELAIYDRYTSGKNLFSARMNIGSETSYEQYKLPLEKFEPFEDMIKDVKLKSGYQDDVWTAIRRSYVHFPLWNSVSSMVEDIIFSATFKYLWEFDFHAILRLKELLKIGTPIFISERPPLISKTQDLIWMAQKYNAQRYISGMGGKLYIDEKEFEESGIQLEYYSGKSDKCSILTRIFNGDFTIE